MSPVAGAFLAPLVPASRVAGGVLKEPRRLAQQRFFRRATIVAAAPPPPPPPPPASPAPSPSTTAATSKSPVTAAAAEPSTPTAPFTWLDNWYPAAWTADVPADRPLAFTLWQRPYVLFRDSSTGHYVVIDDVCPHRAAPLSEGRLFEREANGKTETILECGYHGWRFNCEGRCVDIPVVSLEKRIPSAADVGGVYATAVSKIGLIFVWLGDRALADEAKLPIPAILQTVDPSRITAFRNAQRRFPFGFTTVLENVADPAHVSWAHHGVQGNRDSVLRTGAVEVLEDRSDAGFITAGFRRGPSENFGMTGCFQAPVAINYHTRMVSGRPCFFLLTWNAPIGYDESKMFSVNLVVDAPWSFRLIKRFTPRWLEHTVSLAVLDGDSPILQGQEHYLQSKARDGYNGKWREEYTFASGSWDAWVIKYRQFIDRYAATMPFRMPLAADTPHERLSRREVNDRYELHTKDCACCAPALRNMERGFVAALVGAGVGGAMVLCSGIAYAALEGGGVAFSARPMKVAALFGMIACFALLFLARLLNEGRRLLAFTEKSHELRTES